MKIWCSLVTSFDADFRVCKEKTTKLVRFLEKYPFEGYLIGGSVGECLSLDAHHLQSYLDIIRSHSEKPVMAGVIDYSLVNVRKKFGTLKPDYFLVTPPIYYRPNEAMTLDYYIEIAELLDDNGSGARDMVIYNNPGRVGFNITRELYQKLYTQIPRIAGVKECEEPILKSDLPGLLSQWTWYSGNDTYFGPEFNCYNLVTTIGAAAPKALFDIKKNPALWKELCAKVYSVPNPLGVKTILSAADLADSYSKIYFGGKEYFEYLDDFVRNGRLIHV